jgi:hypothetical protein
MSTYIASFLIFLGAAAALALRHASGRASGGRCGVCPDRKSGECDASSPPHREVG